MLVVIAILVVVAVILMNGQKNQNIVVNTVSNTVENTVPEVVTEEFTFFTDNTTNTSYSLKYDTSLFSANETSTTTLDYGDITVSYSAGYTGASMGADLKNETHRKALVQSIYTAIEPQITGAGGFASQPVTSFTQSVTSAENQDYYYAIDMTTTNSISRYYFIISDDFEYMFQFEVSSKSKSSFSREEEEDITNTLVGIYATTSTPSTPGLNTITNSIENNTVDNSLTNSTNTVDNTTNSIDNTTNTVDNTTNSIMNVLETNTTNGTTNAATPTPTTQTQTNNVAPLPLSN